MYGVCYAVHVMVIRRHQQHMQWNIVMFFILIGFTELFFRSEVLLITFRQANPLSTARGYGVDPATRIL